MTTLVVTEKFQQAKTFAKVLGANKKETTFSKGNIGYYERPAGSGFKDVGEIGGDERVVVTWAAGHLLRTAMPDQIDERLKRWRMEDLPFFPEKWKFLPASNDPAKSQWKVVKELLDDEEVDTIYIATDADREGCLIYHLMYINSKAWRRKPKQMRCWYIVFSEPAVKDALENAKPQSEYDDLVNASVARMKFDYSYGLNMSRAYTIYHHSTRNVGRVVSSVLYLIVKRQEEIDAFVPEDYITIKLPCKNTEKDFVAEKKMTDIAAGEALAKVLKGETATIKSVEKKEETQTRKLYNTTKLQSDAAKRGITTKQTADALQNLWDLGAISYPRTSAEYLLPAQMDELKDLPEIVWRDLFASPASASPDDFDLKRALGKGGKSAEEASHTGLYPTADGVRVYKEKIKNDANMRSIFLMIASRFLCAIMPSRVLDKTNVIVEAKGEDFTATGSVETFAGFHDFEKYVNAAIGSKKKRKAAERNVLPPLAVGETFTCMTPKTAKKQTNPPKQYNESSLLSAMESAAQFVDDKKLKDMLKNAGIGTAASRPGIMNTVKTGGYVDIKSGRFYPTEKAITLMSSIPENLKTPIMTAQMELKLDEIARGNLDKDVFLTDAEKMIEDEIVRVKGLPPIPDTERYKDNKVFVTNACPKCGADVVETDKMMVCRNNCGFKVWREAAHKKITKEELKSLIVDGHTTKKIEGLKKKAGGTFDCWLYLDSSSEVKFDFSDDGRDAINKNVRKVGPPPTPPVAQPAPPTSSATPVTAATPQIKTTLVADDDDDEYEDDE